MSRLQITLTSNYVKHNGSLFKTMRPTILHLGYIDKTHFRLSIHMKEFIKEHIENTYV